MNTTPTRTRFWHSPIAMTPLIGFIMLFSALMAGYEFVNAGQEKWGEPAWTGSSSGVAIDGFLKVADAKSIESASNPYPEVMPLAREMNQRMFSQHTRLFSWLTVGGELLLPIGIISLFVVRFRRSRLLLVALALLAASLNFLYLTEGDSRSNPPMVFMWMAIIWVTALWPAAALSFAVDLSAPGDHQRAQEVAPVESGAGLWCFFVIILLIVVAGSLEMYWDRPGTFAALTAASIAIAAALTLIKRRSATAPGRTTTRPLQTDPGHI